MNMENIVSKEVIDRAKKWLVKASKNWTTDCTRGQACHTDGSYIAGKGYFACHAWVQHAHADLYGTSRYGSYDSDIRNNKDKNFIVLSCHSKTRTKKNISPEAHDAFVLWLAGPTSPFSKYILNRDDPENLCNGGVVILVGPPNEGASLAEAMWICKVLRYPTENGCSLELWYDLYKAGVNPILALAVCGLYSKKEGDRYLKTGGNSHCHVFAYYDDKVSISSILSGNPPKTNAPNTSGVIAYDGQIKAWMDLLSQLSKFDKGMKISDGWGGTQTVLGSNTEEIIKTVLQAQEGFKK